MPYTCRRCRGNFCGDHRLPEYHHCRGVRWITPIQKDESPPNPPKAPPIIKPPRNPIPKENPVPKENSIPKDTVTVLKSPPPHTQINNPIDSIPRERLCEIVKTYGETIIENPKKLRALLKDLCLGKNTREINVIMSALDENIPHELLKSKNAVPLNILLAQLKKRLSENTYYSEDLVTWSVECWALALGIQNTSQK